jgi:hypothetical protein
MDSMQFLGISFRSAVHVYWFLFSKGILVSSVLAFIALVRWRRWRGTGPMPYRVWEYPLYLHAGVTVLALGWTRGGSMESGSYSPDCIWWNALLAGLYGAILVITRSRAKAAQTASNQPPQRQVAGPAQQ